MRRGTFNLVKTSIQRRQRRELSYLEMMAVNENGSRNEDADDSADVPAVAEAPVAEKVA